MGWVKFVKIFEDNNWVTYKYSHDCDDLDGVVKIRKIKNLTDKDYIITPSKSDWDNNYFAFKVIVYAYKWLKNDEPLKESEFLAFG